LKIAVKARQTGYSFAAALRAVLQCLKKKSVFILLSKGERQSRLLMEKVAEHVQAMGIAAQMVESSYFEGTTMKQLEVRFPNNSVIYGLPANPDTARGYSGNVTLDEFAFHADADKIYSALFPTITRGYSLEIISTPNGQQGKYYELAKEAGLVEGHARKEGSAWSAHGVNIYEAVEQGLKIDVKALRAGVDDEAWQQEYMCHFIATAENFIPPQLVTDCTSTLASADGLSTAFEHSDNEFYLGIDIGRHKDLTVFWLDELWPLSQTAIEVGGSNLAALSVNGRTPMVACARMVRTLHNTPFADQVSFARELLSLKSRKRQGPLIRRVCIDATGMGAPLAEALAQEFGGRVEPVTFTMAGKEDMAYRVKRRMEQHLDLLPDVPEIRQAFGAVKKITTATGNIRFDAERTELGHADQFWGKALADLAADQPGANFAEHAYTTGEAVVTGMEEVFA
jgi:phage FluMu gp28-like protein